VEIALLRTKRARIIPSNFKFGSVAGFEFPLVNPGVNNFESKNKAIPSRPEIATMDAKYIKRTFRPL
jgi:hypothetical protein